MERWHVFTIREAFVAIVANLIVFQIHESEVLHNTTGDHLSSHISDLILLDIKVLEIREEFGGCQGHHTGFLDLVIDDLKLSEAIEVVTDQQRVETIVTNLVVAETQYFQVGDKLAHGQVLGGCWT